MGKADSGLSLSPADERRIESAGPISPAAKLPRVRADWFVATASRPPFYHDLLQLPSTDRALERQLQVDAVADVQDDNMQRSGFNDSGVSKNNRILERHDAAYGAFWRSYDFASNTGRQNLFEHPLGPNAGATSFQPAGGEMIFHLPNGLQAYMLVDAKGRAHRQRPDRNCRRSAPPRSTRRDRHLVHVVPCTRLAVQSRSAARPCREKCRGFRQAEIVEAVRATHPRKAKFQAQIEEDNVRYLKALGTVRRPRSGSGADQSRHAALRGNAGRPNGGGGTWA